MNACPARLRRYGDVMAMQGEIGLLALLGLGVLVIALGFIALILVINRHLTRLRQDFADLRAYLIAILGER